MLEIGDVWPMRLDARDAAGAPADGTVTLTVTDPLGAVTTPAVLHVSTGVYTADVLITALGRWVARWQMAGVLAGSEQRTMMAGGPDLADVKTHLDIPAVTTTHDRELTLRFLPAAYAAVEERCGPPLPVVRTRTFRVIGGCAVVTDWPVLSVTSVTVDGSPVTGFTFDDLFGVVTLPTGTSATRATITYTAGRLAMPETMQLAVLQHVREFWLRSQIGAVGARGPVEMTQGPIRTGWETLLTDHLLPPVVV